MPPKSRSASRCLLLFMLLSLMGSSLVLSSCQSSDTARPTVPSLSFSYGKIYVLYSTTSSSFNDSLAVFRNTGTFLWKMSHILESPVADPSTVYVPTAKALIALDAESGKERWHTATMLIPKAALNGVVYAQGGENTSGISLVALQATDGQLRWTRDLPHTPTGYIRQIDVEQERAYVLTDTAFFVLQIATGTILWSSPARSATLANGMIYLSPGQKGSLIDAVQAADGKLLWNFHPPTSARVPELTTSVLTADGILCVNAIDTLYGLRVQHGELLWTRVGKSIGAFTSPLFTANGVLYFASNNTAEGLLAIQARNGHEIWHQAPGAFVNALDFDRTTAILYATFSPLAPPYAAAVQAKTGQILWKIQPPTTSDLVYQVANGIVYQVLPGGVTSTSLGGKEHYTQLDLTAMRGNDGTSLWSTHYAFS